MQNSNNEHQDSFTNLYRAFVWSEGVFGIQMIVIYQEGDKVQDFLQQVVNQHGWLAETGGKYGEWPKHTLGIYIEREKSKYWSLGPLDEIPKSPDDYHPGKHAEFLILENQKKFEPKEMCDICIYLAIGVMGT